MKVIQELTGIGLLMTALSPAAEFYVASDGADTDPGTVAAPFATLARAQTAARTAKAAKEAPEPVTVHVRGGVYRLAETLKLTAEDSGTPEAPVVYRAYGDEKPVLTGGVPVTGFTLHKGAIRKVDVKSRGLDGVRFRQLYFDGKRQTLARCPNLDPADPITSGWAFVDSGAVPADALEAAGPKRVFRFSEADARTWAQATDGEVLIFPSHEWWNNIVPIQAVDRERRLITLKKNCSYEIKPGDRYFVRGLLEELDAPGEWCLDAGKGVLYFWPPHLDVDEAVTVWAPKLKTLIEIGPDAAHITFQGFTLMCCANSAVVMKDAENCVVAGCTVRDTSGYHGAAIAVTGGRRNRVVGCDIHDVGSHGIQLGGGDQKTLTPAGNVAENNHITRVGIDYRQGAGISVRGVGNRVSRNTVHHVPRWCIGFGGNNNVIELNHLHHASLETSDTGAIYGGSLSWLGGHGTVIRHNFIHDIIGCGRRHGEWWSPYFAWGIYLDWTAMGVTVHGNIVARCPRAGVMVHDGRFNAIENNIIVDCGTGEHDASSQIEFSGWHDKHFYWDRGMSFGWVKKYESVMHEPAWQRVPSFCDPRTLALPDGRTMFNNTVRRNILVYRDPRPPALRFRNVPVKHNVCDENLIWHFGKPIRTGLFKVKDVSGPNLAPNPGFENVADGDDPADWSLRLTSPECTGTCVTDARRSGERGLRLHGVATPANAGKPPWERQVAASTRYIKQVVPGQAYRCAVWLKADEEGTHARIEALSYKHKTYDVRFADEVSVGTDWREYEVAFRFPQKGDGNYHDGMTETFYIRITLRQDAGTLRIDDAELRAATVLDEWQAWQDEGWDRNSVIADPLFVDPANDDYRLKPESPAFKLGFEPIPVEKIGCWRDPLRASWPIKEEEQ